MSLSDVLVVLVRRWAVVVTALVIMIGIGVADLATTPRLYRSSVTMAVVLPESRQQSELLQQAALVLPILESRATSRQVSDLVRSRLAGEPGRDRVRIFVSTEGNVLRVAGAGQSPDVVRNTLLEVSEVLISDLEAEGSSARLRIIEPPRLPLRPFEPVVAPFLFRVVGAAVIAATLLALAVDRAMRPADSDLDEAVERGSNV
jgi:uncharacterized protein involved in exopolysaccharide biosynthesis